MRRLPARMAAILMAAFMLSPLPARALALPPGFVAEDAAPGSDLVAITAIAFMPDGRLIATEKTGYAWIIQNGAKLPQKLWDGSLYVNASGNGGLTGVAVDPHYAQNHYVYFAFTMDPDSDLVDAQAPCYGRVVRFQTAPWDSNQVDFTTGTVLLGRAWGDGVPAGQLDHVMDGLRFAPDGSLFVSAGDGASADFADAGGHDPDLFLPGRTDPAEDIGAFRAQYVRSLAGKILRIDPASGAGYPSNPYFDGDPQSNVSKIWEYGLRNPWRWCFRPGTGSTDPADGRPGTLFIGDVGWTAWEEIDIAPAGGMNFGWPCEEGFYGVPSYLAATPAHTGCGSWGGPDDPAPPSSPVLAYSHTDPALGSPPGFIGNAIMGGLFYEGSIYPPEYHDRYFFADYGAQWIRVATFDAANALVDVQPFATDAEGPVDFAADPVTGDLFYVAINTSHVYRLRYSGPIAGDRPPVAHATGSPLAGLAPLTVAFSSAGTSDPDQDPLALGWNFGDGLGSGDPNPVHRFDRPGVFNAVLTADDLRGGFAHDTVRVVALESAGFPSTALLDGFDRGDGALGAPWTGEVDGFTLASQALELTWYSASILWSGASFAPEQEAYVTFAGPGTRLALLLDTQGPTLSSGALLARYEAPFGQVIFMTLAPGRGWETWGSPIPAHYDAGDQFGARAYGNGVVEVLRNGAVIGSGSVAPWPLVARGGGIGLLSEGPPGARFDDFGGGSTVVSGNLPPRATILAPQDGAFFAAGDTIRLAGAGSDDRDPPGALAYHWDVDLAHNNHIHPQVFTADGPNASFLGENHDDGTGSHYIVRLSVTDQGGLTGTREVGVYPEIDLEPTAIGIDPDPWVGTLTPTVVRFTIANLGRMPAPTSRWALVDGGTTLAQGDVIVAPLASDSVTLTLPPGLTAGDHLLRLVADTLNAVRETREDDNATLRLVTVTEGGLGVGSRPVPLSLGPASPNPARGRIAFALGLPRPARVTFVVRDVQGRRIWEAPAETRPAGLGELVWGGLAADGSAAAPGLYFARVEAEGRVWTRRFALLR